MFSAVVILIAAGLLLVVGVAAIRYVLLEHINLVFTVGFTALVCMLCCLPVMAVLEKPSFPWAAHMMVFLALFAAGALMGGALYFQEDIFRLRGGGIMRQLIFLSCGVPFLAGSIFFFEDAPPPKLVGLLLILAALVLPAARMPENRQSTKQAQITRRSALFGFGLAALAQCAFLWPSYMTYSEVVSNSFRMFYFCSGILVTVVVLIIRQRELLDSRKCFVPSMLLAFVVLVICGLLVFNGLDGLAAHGQGLIGLPLVTGSCATGFYLFCKFALKEKVHPVQSAGFILGIAGLIAICL
jgi:drug/metabolite transporter (DMT)-like permease